MYGDLFCKINAGQFLTALFEMDKYLIFPQDINAHKECLSILFSDIFTSIFVPNKNEDLVKALLKKIIIVFCRKMMLNINEINDIAHAPKYEAFEKGDSFRKILTEIMQPLLRDETPTRTCAHYYSALHLLPLINDRKSVSGSNPQNDGFYYK